MTPMAAELDLLRRRAESGGSISMTCLSSLALELGFRMMDIILDTTVPMDAMSDLDAKETRSLAVGTLFFLTVFM